MGVAIALLTLLQGSCALAVARNNWGSHLLDRALLTSEPLAYATTITDAGQNFQAALRYNPHYALSYYNLGTIYVQWGDVAASAEAFAQAVTFDPNDRLAHFQLGLVQAAQGNEDGARNSWQRAGAGAFFTQRAKAHLKAGDLDAGMLDALRAVEIDPTDAAAYYALADVYTRQQDVEAVLQVYWAAPDQAESYYKAGVLLRKLDRTTEAIQVLQQVLAQAPDHVNARLELGRVYTDQGACDQAYQWLAPLMVERFWRAPEPKGFIVMGQCLLRQDDPLAAIAYLGEAAALDAKSVDARWLMGQAYEVAGYRDAAIDMYRQVLKLKPEHGPATKALEALGAPVP